MLSRETEQKIRQHLRLARGFLEAAYLTAGSSEFDERNALSRGYYALFHACSALVLGHGIEPSRSHGGLHDQVQRRLGKSFGRFIRDMYESRRFADYEADWMFVSHANEEKLKIARKYVLWACLEAEKKLK